MNRIESWVQWIVTSLLLTKHLSASWCNAHVISCPQHHCRKCGKAICGKCSSKRSTYPIMGFEFQVRMCDDCYDTIKEEEWVLLVCLFCFLCLILCQYIRWFFLFLCICVLQSDSSGCVSWRETQRCSHGHGPEPRTDGHLWEWSSC